MRFVYDPAVEVQDLLRFSAHYARRRAARSSWFGTEA